MGFNTESTRTKFGDPRDAVKRARGLSNIGIGAAMASQAKALAPVEYGELRNSLSASSTSKTVLLNNQAGDKAQALDTSGLKDDEVYVGSNSDHTIFQEYGTRYMVAQPFIRPAKESVIDGKKASQIIVDYNLKEMKQELKKRKVVRSA